MDKAAVSCFGNEEFLYVTNNDRKSPILEAAPNGRRISVCSHGLNCYDRYHNIYFSAALNRQPQHFKLLENLGFDAGHVHSATAHEVAYQAAMRTSLRRTGSTDPVKIFSVGDKSVAGKIAHPFSSPFLWKSWKPQQVRPTRRTSTGVSFAEEAAPNGAATAPQSIAV
jgi:hypothetical protein